MKGVLSISIKWNPKPSTKTLTGNEHEFDVSQICCVMHTLIKKIKKLTLHFHLLYTPYENCA